MSDKKYFVVEHYVTKSGIEISDVTSGILTCPFCGDEGEAQDNSPTMSVQCAGCGAMGPVGNGAIAAINAWNKRR